MPKITDFSQPPELPELEENTLQWWQDTNAFEKSVDMRDPEKRYVFYDGPPFATGMPHYGHLLASTVKDVVPRFWTMRGYRVDRVWGWDCHGLPIENMIEGQLELEGGKQAIEEYGIGNFNEACRAEVLRLDDAWEKIINRLGRWVDFDNNYKTMDTSYMESVWWGFSQLHDKDLIYKGKRVIMYCPRCSTPLSNFEIAMDNSYREITEVSTTYKYKLTSEVGDKAVDADTYLLAWSTTPWNKLATPALAVNPDLTYAKVTQEGTEGEVYILSQSQLDEVLEPGSQGKYEVLEIFSGEELQDAEFELHFDYYPDRQEGERAGVVVGAEFVTDDNGTGVVTLAAYGEEDFAVMQEENIQMVEHVDEEGRFKEEVTPWAGQYILDANREIDRTLQDRGLVYKTKQYTHSVPACYRCDTRLYYSPVPAWFVDVQKLKDRLLENNEDISWYPEHLKHGRFGQGLETAPDWNISRSRYWGTPMPIWESSDGEHRRVISSIADLEEWAVDPAEVHEIADIHRQHVDEIQVWVDDERTVKGTRIDAVFDCWVESGSMPFASIHYPFENKEKFEENYPAQFISEYIAQTRAWFYCLHVLSTGIFDAPAFENALTTGTILAEDGSKMSKSKKNYPDPMKLIDEYGVDSLRMYLMSSTVMKGENFSFNEKDVSDIRRKVFVLWWNLLRFYNQFATEDHDVTQLPHLDDSAHIMDRWMVSRMVDLTREVTQDMEDYDVVSCSRKLMDAVNQVSTWYLRLSRDRLRDDTDGTVSHVFGATLYRLAVLMAPFAPYFTELVHHSLVDPDTSIHHQDWPDMDAESDQYDEQLQKDMAIIERVIETGRAGRAQEGIKLRQPLASIAVTAPAISNETLLDLVEDELNVKAIQWHEDATLREPETVYDLALTPELEAEGEARMLVRKLQRARKKAGTALTSQVIMQAPDWPEEWEDYIMERANITRLERGDEIKVIEELD